MIDIRNVHKCYRIGGRRNVQALRGATLSIGTPGFHAIMGPSGSGKSTLLHLVAGLDRPDSGEIHVANQPVHALSEADLTTYRRLRVGIIFQQFNLIATMTALENVALPGMLDGRADTWSRRRAGELLESLGLADRADHRPDALSGGEQQRVGIARAMFFAPGILLADEPTGNLDSATSRQIWAMLGDLADRDGITVLMVTHEPGAAAYCKTAFVLRDGVVQEEIEVGGHDASWLANRYQQSEG